MGHGMSEDKESKRGNGPRDGNPRIHGSAVTRNAMLGRFTELKERVQFLDSALGDYSYIERDSEAIYSEIGKFTAIAAQCRINALNHPVERISQHKMTYRPNEYFVGAKLDKAFREQRIADKVVILANGRIAAQGTPEEVRHSTDPLVHQFVSAAPEGPVRFHYPAQDAAQDYGVAKERA